MTPEEYARSFDRRIGPLVGEAAERSPAFAARLGGVGLRPGDLDDVAALDRLPILSKDRLLELQDSSRPFGGLLASDAPVRRIFQSPGPLYEPELDRPDHWRWAPALTAAGFGEGDLVLDAFSYHLSPAGAMFEEGARAVGCRVVPGGVGSADLQVRACADLGVTAYIGLPSYLKALLEKAEEEGVELGIEKAFVTAEPLPPSLRGWLSERVPVVLQGYGTAEAGNLGFECGRADGFHVPEDALVSVCDLTTEESLWDGGEGQVVVTLLDPAYPLIRFGVGDLSAFRTEPCQCGRETPLLEGWLGRVGDAVKVRGMFLHPRQVIAAMEGVEGVGAYRFRIERVEHRDVLRCEVVPAGAVDRRELVGRVEDRVRSALRFRTEVEVVEALPEDAPPVEDVRTWE